MTLSPLQGSMLKGLVVNLLECSDDSVSSSTATAGSPFPDSGSLGDWGLPDEAGCGWVSLWLFWDGFASHDTPWAAAMHLSGAQDLGLPGEWVDL